MTELEELSKHLQMSDDWDEWEPYEEPEEELEDFDCGLSGNGFCYEIGSEWCSFFCPFSHAIDHNAQPEV